MVSKVCNVIATLKVRNKNIFSDFNLAIKAARDSISLIQS